MRSGRTFTLLLTLVLVLAACGPASSPPSRSDGAQTETTGGDRQKTLTLPLEGEPHDPLVTSMFGGSGTIAGDLKPAVHQKLATYDERGGVHAELAVSLPSRENGSWTVRPDGTMQTQYQLRNDVTWHDGTPLTAKDFVFGWTVTRDPDLPMTRRTIAQRIERIQTPDDHTLIIEWSKAYPFANAIVDDDLGPLPVHLLEETYRTNKERFPELPYWTREFVGVGPYQLAEWIPASHITLRAYDRFFRGRAKVDTLTFRFISDPATVTANLLAGSLDGAFAGVEFSQALFVKGQWEQGGRRPLFVTQVTHWQMLGMQFRTPNPRELLDVRVRRALLHATDRQALVDTLYEGAAPISHTIVLPDDVKWEWVKDAVVQYPLDPRRAAALLTEVGWNRGADGAFRNDAGEQVTIPLWIGTGQEGETEGLIIADSWKNAGISSDVFVRPRELMQDLKYRSSFPAVEKTSVPAKFNNVVTRAYGPTCPREETRWSGGNRGCYQNPEMDRVVDAIQGAIEPADQRRLWQELVTVYTVDLPLLPLYFKPNVALFRDGVVGVRGDTRPRTSVLWNVAEWDVT